MYRSGTFVADHVTPVDDAQVQPNGVDLTVGSILEQTTPGRIDQSGKTIGDRQALTPEDDTYRLQPGAYILQYAETVRIPEEHVGFIFPRSSLMRNSGMLNTAVWDAGYEGKGEGLLTVNHELHLQQGARIGQFVLSNADHAGVYDGSYQEERI